VRFGQLRGEHIALLDQVMCMLPCVPSTPKKVDAMHKLLPFLIALASIAFAVCYRHGPQELLLAQPAPPAGCADSNVVAWKAAVIVASGTVSAGQEKP
jgi:hypothetical protein